MVAPQGPECQVLLAADVVCPEDICSPLIAVSRIRVGSRVALSALCVWLGLEIDESKSHSEIRPTTTIPNLVEDACQNVESNSRFEI